MDKQRRIALGYGLLFCLVFFAHIWVSPNRCSTFDSDQYLHLAAQITGGRWMPALDQLNAEGRPFNPYGLSYPYAIALFSLWGTLPLLWASKAINLFLILLGVFRLCRSEGFQPLALLPLLSAQFVFLSTHTWSEGMLLGLGLNQAASANGRFNPVGFILTAALITLTRHQGIFLVLGATSALFLLGKISRSYLTGALLTCAGLLLAYLGLEAMQSGMLTGGARPGGATAPLHLIKQVVTESAKSFLWINKQGMPAVARILILLLTIGLAGIGLKNLVKRGADPHQEGPLLMMGGLYYFAAALPLVAIFSFHEGINERYLGPGLLLLQMGLLAQLPFRLDKGSWALPFGAVLALVNLPWKGLVHLLTSS